MLIINEIVHSTISGECSSFGQGVLCTLIRLQGCPLRCKYCDAPKSQNKKCQSQAKLQKSLNFYKTHDIPNTFLITGGEPLLQETELFEFIEDVSNITKSNFIIETSGAIKIPDSGFNICWVADWKLKNSGEERWMRVENLEHLSRFDYIKFVISNEDDFNEAYEVRKTLIKYFEKFPVSGTPTFAFSPVHGKMKPDDLFNLMNQNSLHGDILNLQIHKLLNLA